MKKLALIGLALAGALSGCGFGDRSADASPATFEAADKFAIAELQTKFHEANSTKNLELLMSLFADDAVFTLGGHTYTGKGQIRNFYVTKAGPFRPENHWTSLHPAFKVRITAVEDRGTVHFECHYVDITTQEFKSSVAADAKVARIDGKWLFRSLVASNASLG
jgi:uncharacterized protein (TIGR02246 family)